MISNWFSSLGGLGTDLDFTIHYDKDLDASLCLALQYLIQPPFLIEIGRSPQE